MSKINAIRLINLNYNYNGIRVDDETFHLNGESSLLTLRNGGGKSVLVQMLISPFVHKRYRNIKDRKFSSYFTTNKPTFILIEWLLDGNAGYVLTGMMVRKSQEVRDDDSQDELDMIQFIHEYKEQNPYDIHQIPFIKTDEFSKTLKTFSESRALLDSLKTSNEYRFSVYDMNNNVHSRNYYNKLTEYQIYHKEWESIIRKINLKESGLSELFTNAKDETDLISTWFLPTIEDKLNKDRNRIDEFRDILGIYIKQYKDNKSKIDQKNVILLFKEETSLVLEIAENLKGATGEKSELENKIANLIKQLDNYKGDLEDKRADLEEKDSIINDEINHIKHEELSFEIYGLEDEALSLQEELTELTNQISQGEEDKESLIKNKNIQHCARIYEQYKEASFDVQELENKLDIIKDKEKDRTPEREALGSRLRYHYENELQTIESHIYKIQEELKEMEEEAGALEDESENLKNKEIEESSHLSKINANISNFDKTETNYNRLYKEDLNRNILGKYEEGSLEIRIKRLKEDIEETGLEIVRLKNLHLENEEKIKAFSRQIQSKASEHATIQQKIVGAKEKLEAIEKKIELRKSIIRHIGFSGERVFDTEDILIEFQKMKDEVSQDIRTIEIRKRDSEEEYNKIKSGEILELPDDIKEALDMEGINYIYGMDWLKRNQKSFTENRIIIENNPFIPYSLILTAKDMARLKGNNLEVYTSFPIPLVVRENLERKFEEKPDNNPKVSLESNQKDIKEYNQDSYLENKRSSLYISEKVNFYLLFNNNLLNEEELSKILADKENEIQNIQILLDQRRDDLAEYEDKYNKIFYQGLTRKDYMDSKKVQESLLKAEASLENELNLLRENEEKTKKDQQKLSDTISTSEKVLDELKRKDIDLSELYKEYNEYLVLLRERNEITDNISKIKVNSQSVREELIKLRQARDNTSESRMDYKGKQKDVKEKLQEYLRYTKCGKHDIHDKHSECGKHDIHDKHSECGKHDIHDKKDSLEKDLEILFKKDIEDIEARYVALTKEITSELKDIEEDLAKANRKFDECETDLINRTRSLQIKEEEYKDVKYDSFILESLENAITNLEAKIKELNNKSSDLKSKIAVKENQVETSMKKLANQLGKETVYSQDLLAKNEIVLTNFKERIIEKKDELRKLKIDMDYVINRIGHIDNNLSALAEYYELVIRDEIELSSDIRTMDKDSLDKFRGRLIRDYRNVWNRINDLRSVLMGSIDKLLRNRSFQDDFFSRPINTLYSLIEEPADFIDQLATTIKAYDDLIAKLEVDIALVDKEKDRIIQILFEYISDIHKNLGKIDKNSTIKIRDKSVKMLRIELPDWEQSESQYQNRLKEMIEDLTKSGINRLENNENIEEIISPIITTNNLYNTVVGISNIRIRLYKIEAQRQYQIDWAEVSKNSGGEGFLSAFVILSSLLSFMRRDDTDIFAESEEGKVLIMDNPFAQTNAAHLLGPLMDVANKSNTQLIAFTGLSGDTIYNSFENIYVLNLVPSKLKKGMQYLKSSHTKGEDAEIMITSQVRTEEMEQLDLFDDW